MHAWFRFLCVHGYRVLRRFLVKSPHKHVLFTGSGSKQYREQQTKYSEKKHIQKLKVDREDGVYILHKKKYILILCKLHPNCI